MRRAIGLLVLAGLAGCAARAPGVLVRGPDTDGRTPRTFGLLFPRVEAGAAEAKGAWPGGRRYMGSEVAAIVHARMLQELGGRSRLAWRDYSGDDKVRQRVALLSAAIHREWYLNGTVPERLAGELGRTTGDDCALMVSIMRFGPAPERYVLTSLSGLPKAAGEDGGPFVSCGIKLALIRTPGGRRVWEAGYVANLPASGATQEAVAAECVRVLLEAFPWRK